MSGKNVRTRSFLAKTDQRFALFLSEAMDAVGVVGMPQGSTI